MKRRYRKNNEYYIKYRKQLIQNILIYSDEFTEKELDKMNKIELEYIYDTRVRGGEKDGKNYAVY